MADELWGTITRRTLKRVCAAWPNSAGTVVLIYHRVGAGCRLETELSTTAFEQQVSRLSNDGRTVSLRDGLTALGAETSAVRHGVVVTFDDGTVDFTEVVLPILARHRVPVTLFLATAFIEQQRPFPDDGQPLSWAALRDACSTGLVDVGSHTHTHALLDRLPPDQIADELDRSKGLIEERLSRPCLDFAYPKALPPAPAADAAVRARFRSAALAGTRPNVPGKTDVYRLARSPIQRSDGMKYFEKKVAGGMALEDTIRRVANRWRYRGATT
jgi:peptidoglycan/xylan/chitin deacetylase (PgdA/CDA1 family)